MQAVTETAGSPSMPPGCACPHPTCGGTFFFLPDHQPTPERSTQLSHCTACSAREPLPVLRNCTKTSRFHPAVYQHTTHTSRGLNRRQARPGVRIKQAWPNPSKSCRPVLDQLPAELSTWGCSTQADKQAREELLLIRIEHAWLSRLNLRRPSWDSYQP